MLRIVNVEELEAILLRSSDLVKLQEQHSPIFVPRVQRWLGQLSAVLAANRLALASGVAGLSSEIEAAAAGLIPAGLVFRRPPTSQRLVAAVASYSMQRAIELVSGRLREEQQRIAEATHLSRQVLAVVRHQGLLPCPEQGGASWQYLRAVRSVLLSVPDLRLAVTRLEGLIGPQDTLVVLDRVLTADADAA